MGKHIAVSILTAELLSSGDQKVRLIFQWPAVSPQRIGLVLPKIPSQGNLIRNLLPPP